MKTILFNGKGLEQTGLVLRHSEADVCVSNTKRHADTVSGGPSSHRGLELAERAD